MSQPPQQDPNERIEFNTWIRSPGLQRADYRPEATSPDASPRVTRRLDRATLIVLVLIVIALILVFMWILGTGGFGTPPLPTSSS